MRLMIFSDIHGNLEALESVLADATRRDVHRAICLGDLVGYGPHPNECVKRIRSLKNCRSICGNHDAAVLWDTSPYGMTDAAKKAVLWTMDELSDENKKFLSTLPDRIDLGDMSFVHANPYNPRGWRYVLDRKYAMRSFGATSCRHLFIGHSHRPLIITRKHWLSIGIEPVAGDHQFEIVPDGKRRIFNCGSVGQPRDDDPRGCYMILDTRKNLIEFHRVAYDTEKTAQAIGAAGLPRRLGRRLKKGH